MANASNPLDKQTVDQVLVGLILKQQPGIGQDLKARSAVLKRIPCTDKKLGVWIDDLEIKVVIEILMSPDDYFNSRFPEITSFTKERRLMLALEILIHAIGCKHCQTKIAQDVEWEKIVDQVFEGNRDEIRKMFSLTSED